MKGGKFLRHYFFLPEVSFGHKIQPPSSGAKKMRPILRVPFPVIYAYDCIMAAGSMKNSFM